MYLAGEETSGTIVTGGKSELPAGRYRVRVRMKDVKGRALDDTWEFTVD